MFRPKHGPVFTLNRLQHMLIGAEIVLLFTISAPIFHTDRYSAIVYGVLTASLFGFLWELATPLIAKITKWSHPFGDLVDFLAYQSGAILTGLSLSFWIPR